MAEPLSSSQLLHAPGKLYDGNNGTAFIDEYRRRASWFRDVLDHTLAWGENARGSCRNPGLKQAFFSILNCKSSVAGCEHVFAPAQKDAASHPAIFYRYWDPRASWNRALQPLNAQDAQEPPIPLVGRHPQPRGRIRWSPP